MLQTFHAQKDQVSHRKKDKLSKRNIIVFIKSTISKS